MTRLRRGGEEVVRLIDGMMIDPQRTGGRGCVRRVDGSWGSVTVAWSMEGWTIHSRWVGCSDGRTVALSSVGCKPVAHVISSLTSSSSSSSSKRSSSLVSLFACGALETVPLGATISVAVDSTCRSE